MRLQEIDWREEIGIARRRLRDVGGATDLDAYMPDVYETRHVLAWANIGMLSAYEIPYASRKHSRKYIRSPSLIYPLNQFPESCEIGLIRDCVLSQEERRLQ